MQRHLIVSLFVMLSLAANAEIKLPAIVSSGMVLQRDTEVTLWGWARSNDELKIELSWEERPIKVMSNNLGYWKIQIRTTLSKSPQTVRLSDRDSELTLDNVLFGEVWICSGQSNMQQPVKGFAQQPTFGMLQALINCRNSQLRLFTVGRAGATVPQQDLVSFDSWQEATPENVAAFSAVAYYFGSQLQQFLDVPVGLIHTSWGGSSIQAWMSKEALENIAEEVEISETELKRPNKTSTALFNSMIYPLIPYSIKGLLWYQGEANRAEPEAYKRLFPAMVSDWRSRWEADFSIYFAQIAPFKYGDNNTYQDGNSAFMREAQLECVDLIENSDIVITLDLGDSLTIHPPQKKQVADRMLFLALSKTYGHKAFGEGSPRYRSIDVQDREIVLEFKVDDGGLYANGQLMGFEIAGDDHVFYPASARILDHSHVVVSSSDVAQPLAVRYAWRNFASATLFDTRLLPVSSFRTDSWDNATKKE